MHKWTVKLITLSFSVHVKLYYRIVSYFSVKVLNKAIGFNIRLTDGL